MKATTSLWDLIKLRDTVGPQVPGEQVTAQAMPLSDIQALGQVIDTTWGRTGHAACWDGDDDGAAGGFAVPGHSCRAQLLPGNVLVLTYTTVGTFPSSGDMQQGTGQYAGAAMTILGKMLTRVKSDFRALSGHSLRAKVTSDGGDWEVIGAQAHVSPKTTAVYRHRLVCEIG